MNNRIARSISLALAGSVAFALAMAIGTSVRAEDRPADKILAEIRGVEMPQIAAADRNNAQAVKEFIAKRQAAMERKAGLIGDLYQRHPENPELLQLLPERWLALISIPRTARQAQTEIDRVLKSSKNEKLANEAAILKVLLAFRKAGRDAKAEDLTPDVEEFIKRFPKDDRGAEMLFALANMTPDGAKKAELTQRVEKDYPDSSMVRAQAAERRQSEAVGKPFEIEFVDAIKGGQVNSASLKGKVVIIDFWATWCGPCVREMPNMKALYAKYKDRGVEFVGVSLDAPREEGGYDKLKQFVEKNKIEWPQFYQGKAWDSEFSKSWGINGIPAVFAIGADGNLATTQARGRLEELIPELLAKANENKKAEDDKP